MPGRGPTDPAETPIERTAMPMSSDDARAETPPEQSLGEIGLHRFAPYLLNRIMGRYNAQLQDELVKLNLSTVKMRALAVLSARGGLMVNELAVYCVIEQSTMSRTLNALLKEGLIRREEDGRDSRARRIHLTEAGRETFERIWPALARANEALFKGIPPTEREAFIGTLGRILENIRVHPG